MYAPHLLTSPLCIFVALVLAQTYEQRDNGLSTCNFDPQWPEQPYMYCAYAVDDYKVITRKGGEQS